MCVCVCVYTYTNCHSPFLRNIYLYVHSRCTQHGRFVPSMSPHSVLYIYIYIILLLSYTYYIYFYYVFVCVCQCEVTLKYAAVAVMNSISTVTFPNYYYFYIFFIPLSTSEFIYFFTIFRLFIFRFFLPDFICSPWFPHSATARYSKELSTVVTTATVRLVLVVLRHLPLSEEKIKIIKAKISMLKPRANVCVPHLPIWREVYIYIYII